MNRRSDAQQNFIKKIWSNRGFALGLLVLVVLMSVSVTREVVRRITVLNEIKKIEADVARLQKRNIATQDLIRYLGTSTYQEKEARAKLGLQKEGEKVLLFPADAPTPQIILPNADKIDYVVVSDARGNPAKWWGFFWTKLNQN